jgi:hypothetical protein
MKDENHIEIPVVEIGKRMESLQIIMGKKNFGILKGNPISWHSMIQPQIYFYYCKRLRFKN